MSCLIYLYVLSPYTHNFAQHTSTQRAHCATMTLLTHTHMSWQAQQLSTVLSVLHKQDTGGGFVEKSDDLNRLAISLVERLIPDQEDMSYTQWDIIGQAY